MEDSSNSSNNKNKSQIFKHTYRDRNKIPKEPLPLPWASQYKLGHDGVYVTELVEDGVGDEKTIDTWIFSPLVIEARTRDISDKNWGLLLSIRAPDHQWHRWAMPMEFLANKNKCSEALLSFGLQAAPGYQGHLYNYLLTSNPERMVRCLIKTGWYKRSFVLPGYCLGEKSEDVFLQSNNQADLFNIKGTLNDWKYNIAKYCENNSRLIFAISTAFAAPLLYLSGFEGGGIHFVGESSIGKSVLLHAAGSVAGGGGNYGFLRRWRTTDNALENIAVMHNDCLLCLDEIGQVDAKIAAEIAYLLSNGQGKSRLSKDVRLNSVAEWRLLFLSNGEVSLQEKIESSGQKYMAGQSIRVLDVPADAGEGFGVFDCLNGFKDGKTFSEYLQTRALKYYGTPLHEFMKFIARNPDAYRTRLMSLIDLYYNQLCASGNDGQVNRAAKRFALIASAGEMAATLDILPIESGASFEAAQRCFNDWLKARGGSGAQEQKEIIKRARHFISENRHSRFEAWHKNEQQRFVQKSAGFWREEADGTLEYMIYSDTFRKEICFGGNPGQAARYLLNAGFLTIGLDGKLAKAHTPPSLGKTVRFYTIKGDILSADE